MKACRVGFSEGAGDMTSRKQAEQMDEVLLKAGAPKRALAGATAMSKLVPEKKGPPDGEKVMRTRKNVG